jgi:SNF2 family DNA or RNA helicase
MSDLTIAQQIEQLRAEMYKLRIDADTIQHSIANHQDARKSVVQEIAEFEEMMRLKLEEMNERRKSIQDQILADTNKKQAVNEDIVKKDKEITKLLELQDNESKMMELSRELNELCAEFEAWSKAHPYQMEDVIETINAYRSGKGGMLNANEMSLGKTFETIVTLFILENLFIKEYGRKPRILWITKKSLVKSTPKEFKRWWPKKYIMPVLSNKLDERQFQTEMALTLDAVIITNYEALGTTPILADMTWDFVIMDEVHKLKGGAAAKPTRIFTSVEETVRKARFQIMLSGTPMVNKVEEMWAYLHIFNPERFPSFRDFVKQYGSYKGFAKDMEMTIDSEKLLKSALKGQMIRRTKSEVGLQLPDFTLEEITLEMNDEQREVYTQMKDNFFLWLDEQGENVITAAAIIAQMTRLRQINVWPPGVKYTTPNGEEMHLDVASSSKIDEAMDRIRELRRDNQQYVLGSTFNAPLYEVKRRCDAEGIVCRVLSGESADLTGKYEEEFQQGKIHVLCMNTALGEGLNLHKDPTKWPGGASFGGLFDKWWSPARQNQFMARIHRMGCVEPVTFHYYRNEISIDTFLDEKNAAKEAAFAGIEDSQDIRPASEWRNYLKEMI